LTALIDARTLPDGQVLTPDLVIVGGGPAGITLAMALANTKLNVLLLESGGSNFDPNIQRLYSGSIDSSGPGGSDYAALDAGRLRSLGGGTNHWGGWCRPMDAEDFEARPWMPYSGWPFPRKALEPYYPKAQSLVEAGPWIYDQKGDAENAPEGSVLPLGRGGLYTSWFQFSKMRGSVLPTQFGHRYEGELKTIANLTPLLHANVTAIRLAADARKVDRLDVATLTGKHFTVKPRFVVLAAGGMENARLLLASNDVMKTGIGNQNDLVGRFFADNPIPRDVATLVCFAGPLAPFYGSNQTLDDGAIMRATFAPTAEFRRKAQVAGSLSTIEQAEELDETGKAAVVTTAIALGVDASGAKTYSLGCGIELSPDPDRRLVLTGEKDALGLPRLKLKMRIADQDFDRFRRTLAELGRQLLAARIGMLRINCKARADWMQRMDWGHHHLGTTRMHNDPKQGVVDAEGLVHGLSNLYVAGSSTFPSYSASNPTLNLVALTLRLGDHLKKVVT
jgi:choline dehydrogenase-like flavoprotein